MVAPKKLWNLKAEIYFQRMELGDFAEAIGINRRTFSGYLNGHAIPSSDLQERICKKLGKSREYLFGDGKE